MLQNAIMSPLGRALGLVIIFAVYPLLTSSINSWYLQTTDACRVNSERVDVVSTDVDDWSGAVALQDNSGKCAGSTALTASTTYYTPSGRSVASDASSDITGGVWTEKASFYDAGGLSGLVQLIMSAAGLGLPIAAMIGLASFGSSFAMKMGGSPLIGAILLAIGLLLVGALLDTVTPFISVAFESLDGDRFIMYRQGIGALASVVGNFYGVVLVGGLIYVAWQVIGQFRGGGSSGGSNMFSGQGIAGTHVTMLLFAAVLVLFGTTEVIGGWDAGVLPPVVRWTWWTAALLACGVASIYERYGRFHQKALGLVAITMFYLSYPLMWRSYVEMIPPAGPGGPELWPTLFLVANVLLAVIMVTVGPLLPVVRVERD